MVPDDLAQAVLSREDVVRYLQSSHGGSDGRERVFAYLEELKTTQRYPFYRALKHPLYPILRKIDRRVEHLDIVEAATRAGRVIYASNHKSHTDYLVEPVVLDDNGVRPPIIAAGHQSLRRSARLDSQARDGRDSHPPQRERSGVPRHAQGVRRRAAAPPRSPVLSRGWSKLQRRAEVAEDRPAACGAALRNARAR